MRGHSRLPELTPELAQEIAGETSTIIGLTVSITDRDGVVIGSGDTTRVGTVDEASLEVLRTPDPATFGAEREHGITLPIVLDGEPFGTVGLTGTPGQVRQFGLVVRRQTEILLRESLSLRSRLFREQALEDLLRDIASFDPDVAEPGAIAARAAELGIDPALPRVAVLAEVRGTLPSGSAALRTVREVFADPQDVVAELTAGRFAVLHHVRDTAKLTADCERLAELMRERHALTAWVGFGTSATDVAGLHASYRDAATALRLGPACASGRPGTLVFPISRLRVHQLLDATAHPARGGFVRAQLGGLRDDQSWPTLRETVLAWCESGFNLVRAADVLHIHRNTLIYRLDKITRLAGKSVREPTEGIAMYLACVAEQVGEATSES